MRGKGEDKEDEEEGEEEDQKKPKSEGQTTFNGHFREDDRIDE